MKHFYNPRSAIDGMVNPACEIERQLDTLRIRDIRQALDVTAFAYEALQDVAIPPSTISDLQRQYDVNATARDAIDELMKPASVFGLSDANERFSIAALNSTNRAFEEQSAKIAELIDQTRVIDDMKRRFGEALPGYEDFVTRTRANIDATYATYNSVFGTSDFAAIERDFEQLTCAAAALRPLEQLSESLIGAFGTTLTVQSLQDYLIPSNFSGATPDWIKDYQAFATLVQEAMRDDDVADAEQPTPDEASSVPETQVEPPHDVHTLAVQFVFPAMKLQIQLHRVASRIGVGFATGVSSWKLMLFGIAREFPHLAPAICSLAFPLMLRLHWFDMQRGIIKNGGVEALVGEDADEFEALANAMIALLVDIEATLED